MRSQSILRAASGSVVLFQDLSGAGSSALDTFVPRTVESLERQFSFLLVQEHAEAY